MSPEFMVFSSISILRARYPVSGINNELAFHKAVFGFSATDAEDSFSETF